MGNLNKETLINNYKKVIKSYPTSDILIVLLILYVHYSVIKLKKK